MVNAGRWHDSERTSRVTALEHLTKRARIAYALAIVPYLPGFAAFGIALLWSGHPSPVAKFAVAHWWTLILGGFPLSFIGMVVGVRILLCPYCDFRLAKAGAGPTQFLGKASAVKFCPNCGSTFGEKLDQRAMRRRRFE